MDLTCTIRRGLEDHHLQEREDAGGGKLHREHDGIATHCLNEKKYAPHMEQHFFLLLQTGHGFASEFWCLMSDIWYLKNSMVCEKQYLHLPGYI